ncbi:hypothetical protein G5I_11810 [Acromyrmex echinatior]|uniref:Uncharacterized protein n=1 Tax=Acromyrmex echinatior TaxID=103372 RepID=F4X0N0_ACREC|nr:hypothetical protein G5I_11810 [Acromyrmex echinatior]
MLKNCFLTLEDKLYCHVFDQFDQLSYDVSDILALVTCKQSQTNRKSRVLLDMGVQISSVRFPKGSSCCEWFIVIADFGVFREESTRDTEKGTKGAGSDSYDLEREIDLWKRDLRNSGSVQMSEAEWPGVRPGTRVTYPFDHPESYQAQRLLKLDRPYSIRLDL